MSGFLVIFGPVFDVFFCEHFWHNLLLYNILNSGYQLSYKTLVSNSCMIQLLSIFAQVENP